MEKELIGGATKFQLNWTNSSNVLCNYMKEQRFLNMILQNKAIIPRYVIEPVDYLGIDGLSQICFPMTCFCDIPFSKVSSHMSRYGEYGIGIDKDVMLRMHRIQPVHYINSNSPLMDSFKKAFNMYYKNGKKLIEGEEELLDYLHDTLLFMKPIWSPNIEENGSVQPYIYQDECEWRFIPLDNFPKELHLILLPQETSEKGKNEYSKTLANHKECWLCFEWSEVRYIMVPDESAAKRTIDTILNLNIGEDEKYLLISKMEISKKFSENM